MAGKVIVLPGREPRAAPLDCSCFRSTGYPILGPVKLAFLFLQQKHCTDALEAADLFRGERPAVVSRFWKYYPSPYFQRAHRVTGLLPERMLSTTVSQEGTRLCHFHVRVARQASESMRGSLVSVWGGMRTIMGMCWGQTHGLGRYRGCNGNAHGKRRGRASDPSQVGSGCTGWHEAVPTPCSSPVPPGPTSKGGIPSSRNGRGTKLEQRTPVYTPNLSSHWHRHRPFNMNDGPTGPAV
eukprot:1926340-Rhodomonas_salina.6